MFVCCLNIVRVSVLFAGSQLPTTPPWTESRLETTTEHFPIEWAMASWQMSLGWCSCAICVPFVNCLCSSSSSSSICFVVVATGNLQLHKSTGRFQLACRNNTKDASLAVSHTTCDSQTNTLDFQTTRKRSEREAGPGVAPQGLRD